MASAGASPPLRQPRPRTSSRNRAAADALRVHVLGRAPDHREGDGIAAQPDRHLL